MIKACDRQLRFVFLRGVSKLAGLFSGLNNLNDITLDARYGDICGYTDAELDAVFVPKLEGLDREKIRRWYNGYNWMGPEMVYNPFDVLLLFDKRRFDNYWFQSGTPTFLVETLVRRGLPTPDLDGMTGSEALLSTFDVDRGASVPDRLPDHRGRGGGREALQAGLPEPGGAPEPGRSSAGGTAPGRGPQEDGRPATA